MGGPEYPSVEASAAQIAGATDRLQAQLRPPILADVVGLPPNLISQLGGINSKLDLYMPELSWPITLLHYDLDRLTSCFTSEGLGVGEALRQYVANNLGSVALAMTQRMAPAVEHAANQMSEIAGAIYSTFATAMIYGYKFRFDPGAAQEFGAALGDSLGPALNPMTVKPGDGWAELLKPDYAQLVKAYEHLVGESTLVPGHSPTTIGGSIVEGLARGALPFLTPGSKDTASPKGVLDAVREFAKSAVGNLNESIVGRLLDLAHSPAWMAAKKLTGAKDHPWGETFREIVDNYAKGSATPALAWSNAATALGMATAAGLLAAETAALSSFEGLTFGIPGYGNVAAILGKVAGYDPLISIVSKALYGTYVGTPLGHWAKREGRPTLPDPRQALAWYWSRRTKDMPGRGATLDLPYETRRILEYAGYPDPYCDALLDVPPNGITLRYVQAVAQWCDVDADWITEKLERGAFSDDDIGYLRELVASKAAVARNSDAITNARRLRGRGYISRDEHEALLLDLDIPDTMVGRLADAADVDLRIRETEETIAQLLSDYDRDRITDDVLQAQLALYIQSEERRTVIYNRALATRYRKIYRTTPAEGATEKISLYRQALVAGLLTENEFRALLELAELEAPVRNLMVRLAVQARDAGMAAQFRSWQLPALRDQVVHGDISVEAYMGRLKSGGFPPDVLPVERRYVETLAARYLAGRVERYQLPAASAAYVASLIPRVTLRVIMEEARLTVEEERRQLVVLDAQRAAALARQKRAAKLLSQQTERDAARARAETLKQAAAAARAAAAGIRALLKAKPDAGLPETAALLDRLESLYAAANELLPDAPYYTAAQIVDQTRLPGGPDLDALDSLLSALDSQLASLAGQPAAAPEPAAE